jgi:uncharacterized protein
MPRHKCKRMTSYQPLITRFLPKDGVHDEPITLIPEEIEALYLMDLLGLYQEDAATKMEVSRPTFARIIKTARQKVALGLLCGHQLHLEVKRDRYVVAFCCDDKVLYNHLHPKGKYIFIFTIQDRKIENSLCLDNPVYFQDAKPPLTLTPLFQEHGVNFFLTSALGQGLKSTLASRGIQVISKESIAEDEIAKLF